MKTKNITVSVDEETHRRARIRAAELDTSVSALVRAHLQALAEDDSAQHGTEADHERSENAILDAAQDAATCRHVQRLYDEAQGRAEAMAGSPISNVQELVEMRRRLLKKVATHFDGQGIGIGMPGVVDREEMYDRGNARLEARLAAAEKRGETLEGEVAALKARIDTTAAAENAAEPSQ